MKGILVGIPTSQIDCYPVHVNTQDQHMTLLFGVEYNEIEHLIGNQFQAYSLYETWDDLNHEMVFELNGVPCQNRYPHVSISWANGSSPSRSNCMIALCQGKTLEWGKWMDFRIEFQPFEKQ